MWRMFMRGSGTNSHRQALKISAILGVTLAFLTFGSGHEAVAEGKCAQPEQARSSPAWQAFEKIVREHYVEPGNLHPSKLSAEDWALVLGHALGRQAPALGDSVDDRVAFDCLETGIKQVLAKSGFTRFLPLPEILATSNKLYRRVQEAALGMHDTRIEELTGDA